MGDTRFAVIMLPYSMQELARPKELMIDYTTGDIYVKSEDGLSNIKVGGEKNTVGELVILRQHGEFANNTTTNITITIPEYNPEKDSVQFYIGGLLKTLGLNYQLNGTSITKFDDSDWARGNNYDIQVLKNLSPMNNTIRYDGSLLEPSSVTDVVLSDAEGQIKDRVAKLREEFNDFVSGGGTGGGTGSALATSVDVLSYTHELTTPSNDVFVDIDRYEPGIDPIFVFRNSVKLIEDRDYTINTDYKTIHSTSDAYDTGDVFDISVFKAGDVLERSVTLATQSSEVDIDITRYDPNLDTIFVFKNSVKLIKDRDFTINKNNGTIIPIGLPWSSGTVLDIAVLKVGTTKLNSVILEDEVTGTPYRVSIRNGEIVILPA